ncbi:hypothetical protein HID58_070595 [Brassica napus]|uniref:Replication factor A C-terminal domain-containing protein n=1 Tax=Brassica napus TaxID=3708 RepID=A0ABQ7YZ82_BRANA|nr:hypothetical protein HID58_070595 [Brassica napus]
MANQTADTTVHASPPFFFRHVSEGPGDSKLLFKLIYFLEARNNLKGGILIGLELQMIDEEVMYRVADQKLVICFTHTSVLKKLEENIEAILDQRFKFHSYADFEANCDLRGDLHDVVGHLKLVDGQPLHQRPALCTKDGSTSQKIMVHLQLKDGPVVNIYLWDQAAENFRRKFDESVTTPIVLLVTTVNPKRLGGKLCLSSMSSSRVFLDQEVDPTKEYLNWLIVAFIKHQPAKIAYFDCIATIDDVKLGIEWYYIACKVCQTKLTHGPTTLMCPKCCNENATASANFRVELSVYDNEEQCTFIILGDAGKELTGQNATELIDMKMVVMVLTMSQDNPVACAVDSSVVTESSGGGSSYANIDPSCSTDEQKKPKRIRRNG